MSSLKFWENARTAYAQWDLHWLSCTATAVLMVLSTFLFLRKLAAFQAASHDLLAYLLIWQSASSTKQWIISISVSEEERIQTHQIYASSWKSTWNHPNLCTIFHHLPFSAPLGQRRKKSDFYLGKVQREKVSCTRVTILPKRLCKMTKEANNSQK